MIYRRKPIAEHVADTSVHVSTEKKQEWAVKSPASHTHTLDSIIIGPYIHSATIEKLKYGVESLNPLDSIHAQFVNITTRVSNHNGGLILIPGPLVGVKYSGSLSGITGPVRMKMIRLFDGRILALCVKTSTKYGLYFYNKDTDTFTAIPNVPEITVTNTGAGIDLVLLNNHEVLIVVKGSSTTYNIYKLSLNSPDGVIYLNPCNTPNITVSSSVWVSLIRLDTLNTLIMVTSSSTTYNLYIYNQSTNDIIPATPSSVTIPGTINTFKTLKMANGKILISIDTNHLIQIFDYSQGTVVNSVTDTSLINAGAFAPCNLPDGKVLLPTSDLKIYSLDPATTIITEKTVSPVTIGPATYVHSTLRSDGKVMILVKESSGSVFRTFLYDYNTENLSEIILPSMTYTNGSYYFEITTLHDGSILAVDTQTSYKYYKITGTFAEPNPYQFPQELYTAGLLS
jgi:hypothetical protein